jgi:hypothetical protein
MAIWAHLERCEATVKITGLWKPTHGREKDNSIMEKITASGRFRPAQIREINRCRLYLQVLFTSDIADNSGKKWNHRARARAYGNCQYNKDQQHGMHGNKRLQSFSHRTVAWCNL